MNIKIYGCIICSVNNFYPVTKPSVVSILCKNTVIADGKQNGTGTAWISALTQDSSAAQNIRVAGPTHSGSKWFGLKDRKGAPFFQKTFEYILWAGSFFQQTFKNPLSQVLSSEC